MNLKDNVLLEGKSSEAESIAWGEDGKKNSTNRHSTRYGLTCAFWLEVLRTTTTLAHGLKFINLATDKAACKS
jgi:hypothetical protein